MLKLAHRFVVLAATAAGAWFATSPALAVPFTTTTGDPGSADSYVQLGSTTNFGNATDVVIKDNGTGTTTRKGYLRFGLPEGGTTSASLDLTVSINNEGGVGVTPQTHSVNVWGLRDGNAGEAWIEGNGGADNSPAGEIVFSNAPANVTTNNHFTSGAVFLGRYSVSNTAVGGVNTFNAGTLNMFLNEDTNGNATIMLQRNGGNSGHNLAYASDEHATLAAPAISGNTAGVGLINITTGQGLGADTFVQQGSATTNFGSSTDLTIKGGTGTTTRKIYLRYDLSSLAGTDALGAALNFDVTLNNGGGTPAGPAEDFTVEVFGLLNGDPDELWNEATINWNNAPANTTDNNLVLAEVVSLGSFIVPASVAPYGVMFSSAALVDFINADTNGVATFILRRSAGGSANLIFGSDESSANAPRLSLLVAVPEPATGLLGLLSAMVLARRRRAA